MNDHLLTETEAAAILTISPATLRRWRWIEKGPQFVKIGGAVRYRRADLTAFIEKGASKAGPQVA